MYDIKKIKIFTYYASKESITKGKITSTNCYSKIQKRCKGYSQKYVDCHNIQNSKVVAKQAVKSAPAPKTGRSKSARAPSPPPAPKTKKGAAATKSISPPPTTPKTAKGKGGKAKAKSPSP